MKRIVNVARLQLANTKSLLWVPPFILFGALGLSLIIYALESHVSGIKTGGGAQAPLWYFLGLGIQGMTLFFPFSQALGVTRREFVLGNFLIAAIFSLGLGAIFMVGGFIEQATNGWGLDGYFFYLPWVWDQGPLGALLLYTSLAILLYIGGFSLAAAYKRFGGLMLTAILLILALVLLGGIWILTTTDSWLTFFDWFNGFGALSTALAVLIISAVIGGVAYGTIRRMVVR